MPVTRTFLFFPRPFAPFVFAAEVEGRRPSSSPSRTSGEGRAFEPGFPFSEKPLNPIVRRGANQNMNLVSVKLAVLFGTGYK